jgi:hypothetical protein
MGFGGIKVIVKDRSDKWNVNPLLLVQIKYALKFVRMHI